MQQRSRGCEHSAMEGERSSAKSDPRAHVDFGEFSTTEVRQAPPTLRALDRAMEMKTALLIRALLIRALLPKATFKSIPRGCGTRCGFRGTRGASRSGFEMITTDGTHIRVHTEIGSSPTIHLRQAEGPAAVFVGLVELHVAALISRLLVKATHEPARRFVNLRRSTSDKE